MAAAAATLCPTAGTRRIWRPPGRGLVAPAPWRQWPRSSMRLAARPSAGNSPSTSSRLAPTSTQQNSCHPFCGVLPSRCHPSLARPAVTMEQAAARRPLSTCGVLSTTAVSMDLSETVENGETEMSPGESWQHKDEIIEAEPGVLLREMKGHQRKVPKKW